MAEEIEEARVPGALAHLRDHAAAWTTENPRAAILGVAAFFCALVFLVYWYAGPQGTPYLNLVNQANAFLHGRLDIVPEHAKNVNLIEKACNAFEADGSCRPGEKLYITHPPMPAIILLPVVALFGLDINATLVSVVIAALTVPIVFAVTRKFSDQLSTQAWFTALFFFGTIYWYTASNGGVWFFSHTVAILFLFAAVYTTLVRKNIYLTGMFLGAAFLSRQTTAMSLPFFLIMHADTWLLEAEGKTLGQRLQLEPLVLFAVGAAPFVLFDFAFNYLRFGNPLESGYSYSEQVHQPQLAFVYSHGIFDISYVRRHIPVFFEGMPIVQTGGPYILPSWAGMAVWATTPAFLYSLFVGLRDRKVVAGGAALLAVAAAIIISRAVAGAWDTEWATQQFAYGVNLWPFYAMIALAVFMGFKLRDRLVIACWAAIIAVTMTNFTFAASGWAQFGYRYALDFYPFLFLLTMKGMGSDLRWHHKGMIGAGIVVNLWAVLWIYQFEPGHTHGWQWVGF